MMYWVRTSTGNLVNLARATDIYVKGSDQKWEVVASFAIFSDGEGGTEGNTTTLFMHESKQAAKSELDQIHGELKSIQDAFIYRAQRDR